MYRLSELTHKKLKSTNNRAFYSKIFGDNPPKIFDRNVKRIQRDRASILENSNDYDYLREEVARRLLDRLDDIVSAQFPNVLEIGSNAGQARKFIDEREDIKIYIQTDISEHALRRDESKDSEYKIKPIRVVSDEENLPFKDDTFDLVFSNLSMHWINNVPLYLKEIKRVLKDDKIFIGSMFGENTLNELRNSFTLAEQEREGGIRPHISPFAGVSDVGNLLGSTGFNLTTVDQESIVVKYKDPFVLMRDLQNMGENNAIATKYRHLSRETLLAAAAIYKEMYGDEEGFVPATFQIIYMIGWKPHISQPKPKKRGSATHSFTGEKLKKDEPKDISENTSK